MAIHISLSPNSTSKDVWTAMTYFIFPWKWKYLQTGPYISKLEQICAHQANKSCARSFYTARHAFEMALRALQIQKDDEVILQAFTCVVLGNAVVAVGAKPVYVDIQTQNYNIDPKKIEMAITPKTKAIVVQHMFGHAADMTSIERIAKKYHIPLINDCAQSLGAKYKGKPLTSFGDITILSFGRDKIISSVMGGMLLTSNERVISFLKKAYEDLEFPSKKMTKKNLLHPIVSFFILSTYHFFSLGKILLVILQKFHLLTPVLSSQEKEGKSETMRKMPHALCHLAFIQMQFLKQFNEHRRQIARIYQKDIEQKNIAHPQSHTHAKDVFLRYNILVATPRKWRVYFQKKSIILGDWYDQVIGPSSVRLETTGYIKGCCPNAEYCSRHSLNLPTHHKLSVKKAKKIARFINKLQEKQPNYVTFPQRNTQ